MLAAKVFLAIVGIAYLILSIWCVVLPEKTSQSVGFTLTPGSGQSEYLVVYGGLQLGLAILFLLPLLASTDVRSALLACLMIHGSIVLFRAISFVRFSDIGSTTYMLAIVEWIIFLASLVLWLRKA